MLRIRGDKRKKPDKDVRIENLTPLTEQCFIRFNRAQKHKADMQELRAQFLGFPDAEHDDGPDSVEGGIFLLDKKNVKHTVTEHAIRNGAYSRDNERSIY
jgi:phage terminase large subunit-like protein